MKALQLSSSIESAPLINEKRGKVLRDHGIRTIEELLWYLPFRYEDWRHLNTVSEAKNGQPITIAGTVSRVNLHITSRQRFRILDVTVRDTTGSALLRFFNQPYLKDQFEKGKRVIVHGIAQMEAISSGPAIKDPQYEFLKEKEVSEYLQLRPVYERIGTITPKMLRYIIRFCLEALPPGAFGEPLSQKIREHYRLVDRKTAFNQLHFPGAEITIDELDARRSQGHRRLIFEEFYLLELGLAYRRKARPKKDHRIDIDDRIRRKIKEALPFRLTGAQKKVIREIVEDMKAEVVMYRLLQGDVGSGKTIVALMAAMVAIENGLQVAIMAPTEILAEQHFSKICQILSNTTYVVRVLRGGQKRKERAGVLEEVASGACHLVIGTHALIQDPVLFNRLGLVIIDEQHRFGVLQRERLLQKGQQPDCLIMTATPIPRSLALTVYGDLETSVSG